MIAERHRAVAHAWVDGAEIEFFNTANQWIHVEYPKFLENCEYRVKQKPPVVRWRWVVQMKRLKTQDSYVITGYHLSDDEMKKMSENPDCAFYFLQKIEETRKEYPA